MPNSIIQFTSKFLWLRVDLNRRPQAYESQAASYQTPVSYGLQNY